MFNPVAFIMQFPIFSLIFAAFLIYCLINFVLYLVRRKK